MATRRPPSAGMQRANSLATSDPQRAPVERTLSQPNVSEPVGRGAASSAVTRLNPALDGEDDDSDDDMEILEAARRRSDLGWVNKDVDFVSETARTQQRTQQQAQQPARQTEERQAPLRASSSSGTAAATAARQNPREQTAVRQEAAPRAGARAGPRQQEAEEERGSDEADAGDGDVGGDAGEDETERADGEHAVADAGAPAAGALAGPPIVLASFPPATNNPAALREWLLRPVAKGETAQTLMLRKYAPLVKKLFPSFQLFPDDSRRMLLYVKRKKVDKMATYPFFSEKTKSKSNSSTDSYMGKLRVLNAVCTDFVLYDRGERRSGDDGDDDGDEAGSRRHELVAIHFKEHKVPLFARAREPRCMHVLIPVVHEDGRREEQACRPAGQPGLIDRLKEAVNAEGVGQPRGPFLLLQTAQPIWNPQRRSHVLDFGGRVKVASLKNFQLVLAGAQPESAGATDGTGPGAPVLPRHPWVMQFGKTSRDEFALDFRFPLCPLQAMAIALTTMHAGALLDYR